MHNEISSKIFHGFAGRHKINVIYIFFLNSALNVYVTELNYIDVDDMWFQQNSQHAIQPTK